MKLLELVKLQFRANKYKNKNDKGGIAYILNTIQAGQVVLDIGAHKAGYLYFMLKKVGIQGKIYAFEPQLALYDYLTKLKKLLKWSNVVIEHLALSNSAGTVTLFIPKNKVNDSSSPGATIVNFKEHSDISGTETVQTDTLDAYCGQHNIRPNFLKIDVEGNELKIFEGGLETLKKYKPKILVEIEARHIGADRVLETFEFMKTLGYKGQFIHGLNYLPLEEFSIETYQNVNDQKNYCNNFIFE